MSYPNSVLPAELFPNLKENSSFSPDISCLTTAEQVKALAELFRSHSLIGQVLRVLAHYCRNPRTPYEENDLALLLLISTAEIEAGRTFRGPLP